jgi:hypothetical protein
MQFTFIVVSNTLHKHFKGNKQGRSYSFGGPEAVKMWRLLSVTANFGYDNFFVFIYYNALLTDLSLSWRAINWAATQELSSISWNPKVQYRIHKSPPLVPILSHISPIHTIPSYLSQIHFDIVHPPTSKLTFRDLSEANVSVKYVDSVSVLWRPRGGATIAPPPP